MYIICFFFAQRGIGLGSCFDQLQVRVPMGSPQIWAVQERSMSLRAFIESARPGSGSGIVVAEMLSTDLQVNPCFFDGEIGQAAQNDSRCNVFQGICS